MRYGVAIPPCDHVGRVAEAAEKAEALGFDSVWLPDAQLLWRDVFVSMALAADRTTQIRIGSGVSSTETRHPTVVASVANTLRELAPDRTVLGLGSGAGLGQLINMPSMTRAVMRRDIEMMRALLDGQWWDFDGRKARLIGAGGRVPIYMTAGGPKMAQLAGEIADGVIFSVGTTPAVIRASIDLLTPGLEAAGRTRDHIQVVSTAFFSVTDDLERDAARFKPVCCLLAKAGAGQRVLAEADIEIGDLSTLPPIFPTIAHAEDWDEAVELASRIISDDAALLFAEKFGLFGTIDEIAARAAAIEAVGVDELFIRPMEPYQIPFDAMDAFANGVFKVAGPHLATRGGD
jgi:5,10-methylenetetrahydromethanopterin reductase